MVEERVIKSLPADIQGRPMVVRSEVEQMITSCVFHFCFTTLLVLPSTVIYFTFETSPPVLLIEFCVPLQLVHEPRLENSPMGIIWVDQFYTVSQKKGLTCKLSVTLSNLNRFSKFLHYWKAYKIRYKTDTTLPTSP